MTRSPRLVATLSLVLAACGSESSTPPDTTPADTTSPDVALDTTTDDTADTAAPDLPDLADTDAEIEPGSFGAPCVGNADCASGWCVEGSHGGVCTRTCDTSCPTGYDCRSISGQTDITFVCVPRVRRDCAPCTADGQCAGGACLLVDGEGRCAFPCADDAACPDDHACLADPTGEREGRFCQPRTGSCTCTPGVDGGLRSCRVDNEVGTCWGVERCEPATGWTGCTAASAVEETCNGEDDDCDGVRDDGLEPGPCTNEVAGVGACPGMRSCAGELGWVCHGERPEPETCNGLDDDCDGGIDEPFQDAAGAFTSDAHCGRCGNDCATRFEHGVGRCDSTGEAPRCVVASCEEGYVQIGDQCVPPVDTTCQRCASDADCYGGRCVSLENQAVCLMPCAGGCEEGRECVTLGGAEVCAPASGTCTCTPDLEGARRTCSKESVGGTCYGLETCDGTAWGQCTAETPVAESCNGDDDDCDGVIDEDLEGGACTNTVQGVGSCPGERLCLGVSGWACLGPTPSKESCNGQDDDCDGQVDEDMKVAGRYTTDAHCGGCGIDCRTRIAHGVGRCGGTPEVPVCVVASCEVGYVAINAFQCVPTPDLSCQPCAGDGDCAGGTCTTLDGQSVCAAPCGVGGVSCRQGFTCGTLGGKQRCLPVTGSCSCDASTSGASRSCMRQNTAGACFGVEVCDPVSGWSACSARVPALETCNGVDDDCDAAPDDVTGRGSACAITNTFGSCAGTLDCRTGSATLQCVAATPAAETCNGRDDDCDSVIDDLSGPLCPLQKGVCAGARQVCAGATGFLACNLGSYGADYEVDEVSCDGLDNDCDGVVDEVDLDGDGHRAEACGGDDCDDLSRLSYPGAAEICGDVEDNDCNGEVDDKDGDGDGWVAAACGGEDCNDGSDDASPTGAEVCGDGLDNDCDGSIDNRDADKDGFLAEACGGRDCDDGRAFVYPGAAEQCNALDDDCNELVDDKDLDRDGFVDTACGGTDCRDSDPLVRPGAAEICGNTTDEDCSGAIDDKDLDGDGQRDRACPGGGQDCDDADPQVNTSAVEIWDAKDNDCDDVWDEGVIPAGTVIITEIMRDPGATTDPVGEYFEVVNLGRTAVNLRSWFVRDLGQDDFTVTTSVVIAPGGAAVLCNTADVGTNGGAPCDFEYGANMLMSNSADEIILELAGVEIDRVAYGTGFPATVGRSMNLDPAQFTATGNNASGNWCLTPNVTANKLAGGDYGTPRRTNPSCSGKPAVVSVSPGDGVDNGGETVTVSGSGFIGATAVTFGGVACAAFTVIDDLTLACVTPAHTAGRVTVAVTKGADSGTLANAYTFTGEAVAKIDYAALQFPKTLRVAPGAVSDLVYGQVHSPSVTEPAGAPAGILAQVGWGPLGSDPRNEPGWSWSTATWNKQFFANDEFMRSLVIPFAGTYSYAFRFSDDGGVNFMYGDYDPGTADGFQRNNLGTITVE